MEGMRNHTLYFSELIGVGARNGGEGIGYNQQHAQPVQMLVWPSFAGEGVRESLCVRT